MSKKDYEMIARRCAMPETFRLEITLGNDAMSIGADVSRALRNLAERIEMIDGYPGNGRIRDDNGNTVGTWSFEKSAER